MPGLWVRASPRAIYFFYLSSLNGNASHQPSLPFNLQDFWGEKKAMGVSQKKNNFWQLWDSNPRPFGLVPKTSALDHSAKLPVEATGLCKQTAVVLLNVRQPQGTSNRCTTIKKMQNIFAPYEVWTHDPQFTRLVLYHWAKGASYKIVATFSTLLFFCHHPCASSRQPTENISNQGLVNFFRYLNRKSFGYNCASRITSRSKLAAFSFVSQVGRVV